MPKISAGLLLLVMLGPTACRGRTSATEQAGAGIAPTSARQMCGPVFASRAFSISGTSSLSPSTQAFYAFGRDSLRPRGYLLLVRGQPAQSVAGGAIAIGGGGRMDGLEPREHTWEAGSRPFTVRYDPQASTVSVAGAQIALDTANVVLLEHSDTATHGLVVRGTLCAPPLRPDSLATDLWEQVPATRAYITAPGGT